MSIVCPICGSTSFEPLVDFGVIPVSGTLLPDVHASFQSQANAFDYCTQCALIRRRGGAPPKDYAVVDRPTRAQLPAYMDGILNRLEELCPDRNALIVDIGGNDGGFLDLLRQRGYANLLNVEPSAALADLCRQAGHKVYNACLDPDLARCIQDMHGPAQVVFCRHVLEHVPDPAGFVQAVRSLLRESGWLCMELPDARGVLHHMLGHELWDEHLFHYTPDALVSLLAAAGFAPAVPESHPHRDGLNILVWTTTGPPATATPRATDRDLAAARTFAQCWGALARRIRAQAESWPAPVVCIGASHPQANYLLFTGLGERIACLVDDAPAKVGRYVPLPGLRPVVSTAQILAGPTPGTVLRTAFGCHSWMDAICGPLRQRGALIVEPYPDAPAAL